MYEQDLALNYLQMLVCCKTQLTKVLLIPGMGVLNDWDTHVMCHFSLEIVIDY